MSEISILTVDGVSFNLSDDKVRGSLSEVEMTPRASKTYAVGDYLIYQGRFYKVVQVIDQDSFFEIGTNIIPVTVGEELELKASLESPTFSGSPKVPTADVGTRTTQIASTAYVQSELDSVKERIQSVQNGLDGIDSNIGDRVTAVAASTTTAWMNAHITNTDSVLLDSSLTVEGAAADAKAVGDAIDELPKIVNTDEVGADFDLADSDGNVLVRFEDGHIKVKNFDSSTLSDSFDEKIDIQQDSSDVGKALVVGEDGKVSPADISIDVDTTLSIEGAVADAKAVGDALDALSDEIVDSIDTLSDEIDSSINELDSSIDNRISSLNEDILNAPRAVETDEESSDLDFVDQNGYVIARFEDGHFKTKNFDSSQSATKTEVQTVAESVDGVEATVTETKTAFDLLVGDYEVNFSSNLYDPSLQTPETISPHYFVNGVPYSSTQFDTSWNCTDFIPVEPETQYVIALVPSVNDNSKPWQGAGYGWFAYDENKNYISTTDSSNNTFTTPANARYIRFNYYISEGKVSLAVLNARCMMVKGDVIPDTYEKYGTSMTSDLQTKIDSSSAGFEYKFSGNDLLIAYGYNENYDAVVVLNRGRANNLFDFSSLKLKPKDVSLFELETASLSTVWNSGTDMHGPFQFNAINNADGYHSDSTSPGFVGGNHTLDQLGTGFETATYKYVKYFADGKPVSSGYGKATNFEIRWANDVQAYNTVKEGGGGRSCLTEYHDMIFDGVQFDEIVKLVPLEDIQMGLWYGFQFVSFGSKYTKLRFLDGVNRGIYETTGCKSGNLLCSGMEAWGLDDKIIVTVDPTFDLGKREHVGATYADGGAFTSSSKCYFRIITDSSFVMSAGDAYYLKGSYRFCPSVEATGGEG